MSASDRDREVILETLRRHEEALEIELAGAPRPRWPEELRRCVSVLDSRIVHAAHRTAGYPGNGTVIAPARTRCGVVLRGELVDTTGRRISCRRCALEVYGGSLAELADRGLYDGPIA